MGETGEGHRRRNASAVLDFDYETAVDAGEQVRWRVEDLIGDGRGFDFARPFLPESLARVGSFGFLQADERRTYNQLRGRAYLGYCGFIAGFIIPYVLDHMRGRLTGDDQRTRALLGFAANKAKHIDLFNRAIDAFGVGFNEFDNLSAESDDVARAIQTHHPLAVGLAVAQGTWMIDVHRLAAQKEAEVLDPLFVEMLTMLWREEQQHAELSGLMIGSLAQYCSDFEIESAICDYFEIVDMLDGILRRQMLCDIDTFSAATGRQFAAAERATFETVQMQANRWCFIGAGMTHRRFVSIAARLNASAEVKIGEVARKFC